MPRGPASQLAGSRAGFRLLHAVVVAVLVTGITVSAAAGDSAGPVGPSAVVEDATYGTAAWQNPTYAATSNNAYAQSVLKSATSRYLKLTGLRFAVPAGATIAGVTVSVERNVSGTSGVVRDASVRLVKAGSVTGSDRADTGTSWSWSTTRDFTARYGAASDLWGTTLTPADVNSAGFGVAIAARNLNSQNTFAKVDSVTIAVSYTVPPLVPIIPSPPVSTSPPALSGTAQPGQTLSATPGTWTGTTPIAFGYQWRGCDPIGGSCADIAGATLSSYTVASGDIGSTMRVRVTATSTAGSGTADSAATAMVPPPSPPSNTSPPAVSGTAQAGQTLTASPGSWSGTIPIGYSYQWLSCGSSGACTNIDGASSSSYTATTTDVGSTLLIRVTAENAAGSATADSAPTSAVMPPPPPVTTGAARGPATVVDDASFGTVSWQSPSSAATSNNVYSQAPLNNATSRRLKATGFGFSIPAGATIAGVTVSVERNVSGTSGVVRDASVRLVKAGSVTGSDRADTGTSWSWSTTRDFTAGYGSASDLWGTTLTPADVNSAGFGVAIAARNLSSANTFAKVDSVSIAISYSVPPPPSNTATPTVSGTAQDGQTLTASPGTWSGAAPIGYAYQWRRCDAGGSSCSDVAGATSPSYAAPTGDVGSRLRVRVTASNTGGQSTADSPATVVVRSGGGTTDVSATDYYSSRIYDPEDVPYTAWTGAWRNPDGSLWTAFTQSSGTSGGGTPQWARDLLGSSYVSSRDHWDLTNTTAYLSSTDHGRTWSLQQPLGAGVDDVMTTPDAVGGAGDPIDCASSGLGSGCPTANPVAFTPQADIALPDGTLLRRVNGEDIGYDRAVAPTAFIQRLGPGAAGWTGAQYLLDPARYTYQISRIRQLADGRLIALGQVWDAPAGTRTAGTPMHHLLMASSDQGQTWTGGALALAPGVTAPAADEWDAAELPSGDLLAVFRTSDRSRRQGLLVRDGAGWTLTSVATPPFGHSGHPELLADPTSRAVLYLAQTDVNGQKGIWYLPYGDAQAGGTNWTLLPFTSHNDDSVCQASGSVWNCSSRYYPRSVEDVDGTIVVLSHSGSDDPYPPPTNEAIFVQTFKLQGGASTTYEAEAGANTRAGGASATSCAACSAGGKVGNLGNGGTVTLNRVDVATAGSYQVTLGYTDGSAAGRQAEVSVNGGAAQTVSFTPTSDAETPGTLTVPLQLEAGSNTIAFGNSADLAPDLDKIVVPATPG